MSEEDAPDALIADLPDIYIYNVDVVGEGLVARRRGMAALDRSHGAAVPEGRPLSGARQARRDDQRLRASTKSRTPTWSRRMARRSATRSIALGIAKDLSLDLSKQASTTRRSIRVEDQLIELKDQNIPYGLHAFGRTPEKALRDSTVDAIVSMDRSLLPNNAKVLAADMEARIVASGPRELDNLMQRARRPLRPRRQRRRADSQSGLLSDRQEFLRHRSGQGSQARRVGDGRQARGSDAGRPRQEARQVSRESVVRHLGRRDDAPRGRARVADLSICWARSRSGTTAARWSTSKSFRSRSWAGRAWTSSSRRRPRACSTTSRC